MTSTTTARRPTRRRSVGAVVAIALLAVTAAGCMPNDAKTFLDRTNAYRSSHGLRTLQENNTLTDKAEAWAQHLAATGTLAHSSLTAGLGGLRWTALGENVAYADRTSDTLKTIHNLFVASSGHRANLLSSKFTHMGVGVATDKRGRVWVVEVFARVG